jgi:Restriction endonuclease S subunits
VKNNDIVLSMVRPIQRHYGFLSSTKPNSVVSTGFVVISAKDSIEPYFLYSFLTQEDITEYLDVVAEGSTSAYPAFTPDVIEKLPILLPPIPEQRAIAGVLSSLDDKIDLLHRQNKTLEGMAEALWRKIFVEEADPGWKKGKLGDLVELCYGKGLKEEKRIPGKYSVLGSSGIVGYHNDFLVKGPGIVIGRKGTLGVVNYVEEDFFPIDTTYFIKSKTNAGKLFFEYFLLKEFSFEEMNSDSAVPGLNREIAESMEFIVPEIDSIDKFNDYCEPLFSKKMKNEIQIRTLSRLRNTLLPKLMSGEVRVRS